MKSRNKLIIRWVFYLLGLLILALGIMLNTKANLGVSPIISVPYSISHIIGFNFANMTMIVYFIFVLIASQRFFSTLSAITDSVCTSSSLNPLYITLSILLKRENNPASRRSWNVSLTDYGAQKADEVIRIFNRIDNVVTSIRQASASSFWFIIPCSLNSLRILGCPWPTVSPSSIKYGQENKECIF